MLLKKHLDFHYVKVGMEIPSHATTVSTKRSVVWACACRDFDPIHYDHNYAKERKLPQAIVNGRFKIALLIKFLSDWIGREGWICRINAQHRGMDLTGNRMLIKGIVRDKIDIKDQKLILCEVWIEDPEGHRTCTGNATIAIL